MLNILKVFGMAAFAFWLGIIITPFLTRYLYKYKMWKKTARTKTITGDEAVIFHSLHKDKEIGTPRMGGILIWFSVFAVTAIFFLLAKILPASELFQKLNFFSRSQTWLPLFTLLAASSIGLVDDLFQIYGKGKYIAGGMSLLLRIFLVVIIGTVGALWFYFKLEKSGISIPFWGDLNLGVLFIPVFILFMIGLFSGGVIDGIDGLSGGIMASIFGAYSGIAFFQNQIDLAAFSGVIAGAILAFLWFNIPPARFYMGETGMFGLTTTLTVIAFLTNSAVVLPIIAFPLVATSASCIIQIFWKKFFGRKLFLVAPIHHHFEAMGWPSYKVVMRFWVIGIIFAIIGMVIILVGK